MYKLDHSLGEVEQVDFWMRTAITQCIRLQNKKGMIIIFDHLYCDQNKANVKPIDIVTLTIFNIAWLEHCERGINPEKPKCTWKYYIPTGSCQSREHTGKQAVGCK
jgi:hypothetical protein